MAEFDTIFVSNPTNKDFTVRFNGEPYEIKAGEDKTWVIHVALHFAKHLSDKMLRDQFAKKRTEKAYKDNPKLRENDPEKIQYVMYDNPHRRIALYRILRNKVAVEDVIKKYPQFNYKNRLNEFSFIGDMTEYDDFVEKFTKEPSKEEPKPEKEEAPKKKTA